MSKPDKTSPRLALWTGRLAVAAPAVALAVAACGGSGTHRAATVGATSARPLPGATFRGTIYVTTPTSRFTKTFTERVAGVASCAAAARTGDGHGTFRVPSPSAPGPQADIEVTSFHGPGTYTPTMLRRDRADTILLTGKAGTSQYVITSPASGSAHGKEMLFLQKDGSGQLDYSGAHLNGRARDPTVAGLIQWICTS
jgi:hypothetical protein